MKYCGHCGAQLDDRADVCIHCKTPVNIDVFSEKTQSKKEGNQMAVATVIILISVLIIIACYFFIEYSFYDNLLNF